MRKLFDVHSSAQPYSADAVVVSCFDVRIRPAVSEFLRRCTIVNPDMVVVAGGSLTLSSPRTDFDRPFVMDQVRLAIRLHRASRIILMSHSDCATYGGLAAFDGDCAREAAHHSNELCRASVIISTAFPGLAVERIFLTFGNVLSISDQECVEH